MYVIEITEDKVENLLTNVKKGMHCFHKVMQCIEDMKEETSEYDSEEYDEEEYRSSYSPRRRRSSGRYSRY